MSTGRLLLFKRYRDYLPGAYALQTWYDRHHDGTAPFLTRVGPCGKRTRYLWINVDALVAHARAWGWELHPALLQE